MPSFYYDNLLRTATVLSEDTLTNFEFANGIDGRTSTQLGVASGADRDIVLDFGSAQQFSVLCVAVHNLNGASVVVAGSSDNVTYTDITTINYDNNYVRCDAVTQSTYRYVRLRFTGLLGSTYVGDIFLGESLELPYGVPDGFTPPEQADQDLIETNMTGNGALAGIDVTRKPKRLKLPLKNYESSWFESNWYSLTETMKLYPVYFLWSTGKRAFFCTFNRKTGVPSFKTNTRQSVTLDLQGFVE